MPGPTTQYDPIQFLTLAKELAKEPTNEARLRCAVGRAYYAAFLFGRDMFGLASLTSAVHNATIGRVKARKRAVGEQLERLQELRTIADYHLSPSPDSENWKANWQEAEALAERLIVQFRTWDADPQFRVWLKNMFPV